VNTVIVWGGSVRKREGSPNQWEGTDGGSGREKGFKLRRLNGGGGGEKLEGRDAWKDS